MDNNGQLDFNEFVTISYKIDQGTLKKVRNRMAQIYETMDKDASNMLSLPEFMTAIGIDKMENQVVYNELLDA
eukprot:CAMPEP_0116981790 /NCGR_PEP_ID=MMETSP0467-20121206/59937_1 /TAXON_ID=283647 /ORGANISM="Mesodinium pulex, Strain SPMC105" /LENGTH=72 /DNA_ID=CAMNT_0004676119 /DNA_START=726 /DNA_END=944 /DNA_ORIENTATION=+